MLLNTTILSDYMEGVEIVSTRNVRPYSFYLQRFMLWRENTPGENAPSLSRDCLYVCKASALPPAPGPSQRPYAVICIGDIAPDRKALFAEAICVAPDTDLFMLINELSRLFGFFSSWNRRFLEALRNPGDYQEIAKIGAELFINDLCLTDGPFRMLFHAYSGYDARFEEIYAREADMYFPQSQTDAFNESEAFLKLMKTREPVLNHNDILPVDSLMYNIFDGDVYLGQLVVDETRRPFLPSDSSLLFYFGDYMRELLLHRSNLQFGYSEQFDAMIEELIIQREPFASSHAAALAKRGWWREDAYCCAVLIPSSKASELYELSQLGSYLHSRLDNLYLYRITDDKLFVLFNLTQSKKGKTKLSDKIAAIIERTGYVCGLGGEFCDFTHLECYYRQALSTAQIGLALDADSYFFSFEEYALDLLLRGSLSDLPVEALYTKKVKRLLALDNPDQDFLKTVQAYLNCNCNATKAMKCLNIQRTSFYYRLKRIRELSGIDLDDARTRLYLLNLFEISKSR